VSTPVRLVGFALVLVALFGVGIAAGEFLEPSAPGGDGETEEQAGAAHEEEEAEPEEEAHSATASDDVELAPGTARAADGYSLELGDRLAEPGARELLRFSILDPEGEPVTDFDIEHERRMHVIVARDDLTGFQHVHPEMDASGEWSVPVRFAKPGSYRVFADFSSEGTSLTLSDSVLVPGEAARRELPPVEALATSDGGYEVELDAGEIAAGGDAELEFTVSRDGEPVEIQPYLGADGHLVALREGDLAYLHVHPLSDISGSKSATGEPIAFAATFPTAARYRVYLQFKVDGRVETVEFTEEAR
jgi:hypothetical protein